MESAEEFPPTPWFCFGPLEPQMKSHPDERILTLSVLDHAIPLVWLDPDMLQHTPLLALLLEPISQEEKSSYVSETSFSLFLNDVTSFLLSRMFAFQIVSTFLHWFSWKFWCQALASKWRMVMEAVTVTLAVKFDDFELCIILHQQHLDGWLTRWKW